MPTITKAVLTVTSSYAAAAASAPSGESGGYINIWDIRPWLPWESRSTVGSGNWQDYLSRGGVFDSSQAPGYVPVDQGPKSWAKRTDSVTIYDTSLISGDPFTPSARHGSGTSTAYTATPTSPVAFDASSPESFLDTLVVAAYAWQSGAPGSGFPVGTDTLRIYSAYVDVTFDSGATVRYYPQSALDIAHGTVVRLGSPMGVLNAANAIDSDPDTYATIQETNGFWIEIFPWTGFSALWHPEVLLLAGWSWGSVECNDPPTGVIGEAYEHTFSISGGTGPYTWGISAGSLPPGLSLDADTGEITGTPTTAGVYSYTVTVGDASGIPVSVACSITVHPWGFLTCNNPPTGAIGQSYTHSFTLTLTGGTGPFAWSITDGALPDGLTLDAETGGVTGTPTVGGDYTYTVTVENHGGFAISVECFIRIVDLHFVLDLWVWRVLNQFVDLEQSVMFPPGYERALRLQLAAEFARQFPGHDTSRVKAQLAAAVAALDRANVANSQAVEELPQESPNGQ